MGFWKKDPLDLEIIRLEQNLHYSTTEEERDEIKKRLREMYELRSSKDQGKMRITGDGVLRCLTMIGLAGFGYYVEQNGGIIPSWAKQKP